MCVLMPTVSFHSWSVDGSKDLQRSKQDRAARTKNVIKSILHLQPTLAYRQVGLRVCWDLTGLAGSSSPRLTSAKL